MIVHMKQEDIHHSREQEDEHLSEVGMDGECSEILNGQNLDHTPYQNELSRKSVRDHHEKRLQTRAEDILLPSLNEVGEEAEITEDDEDFSDEGYQTEKHANEGVILRSMNEYPTPLHLKTTTGRHRPPPRRRILSSNTSSFSRQGYKSVRTLSTTRRRRAGPSYSNTRTNTLVNELRRRREEAELCGSLGSEQYYDETECIFQELEELGVLQYNPSTCCYSLV